MTREWQPIDESDLKLTTLEFVAKHNLDPNNIYIKIGKRDYYHLTPANGTKYVVVEEIDGKKYITHGQEYLKQAEVEK